VSCDDVLMEIHGFETLGRFRSFSDRLADLCASGEIREVEVDDAYHHGEICGGRWFEVCGSPWRLVEPDFPFRGLWERIG